MKQGWEIKKLGDVCELSAGGDVPKDNFSEIKTEKHQVPIYANGEKNDGFYGFTSKAKVTKPSITVSARGTIGYSVKRIEPFFPIVRLIVVTPINLKELDLDYLDYALRKIDFKHSGSSIPQLTVPMIRDYEIPLPPLPEQQRIVAILDEAFAAIAKAKANAEQNLKNAKELFESYLQGVFENKGEGWKEKTLGEVCSIGDGNYSSKYPKASEFVSEGVPFLTATNLKNGTVIPHGIRFISKEQHLILTKGHIIKGDLVIVVRGSSTGNNSIVPEDYAGSNLNSQLAFLRVKENKLSSEYLFAVFNSPTVMKSVKAAISGAAQPQLPNNKLLDLKICYPSLKEQKTIVQKLNALSAKTKKLEAIYQQKINDLEELKKSVLQKAFKGELNTKTLKVT